MLLSHTMVCNECDMVKTVNVHFSASKYPIDFPFTGGI